MDSKLIATIACQNTTRCLQNADKNFFGFGQYKNIIPSPWEGNWEMAIF